MELRAPCFSRTLPATGKEETAPARGNGSDFGLEPLNAMSALGCSAASRVGRCYKVPHGCYRMFLLASARLLSISAQGSETWRRAGSADTQSRVGHGSRAGRARHGTGSPVSNTHTIHVRLTGAACPGLSSNAADLRR